MNIGEASERSGLPSKTIRYYEDIGLIRPERGGNGYRDYAATDVHKLRFLQRSRGLGFSVEECFGNCWRSMRTRTGRVPTSRISLRQSLPRSIARSAS